MNTRNTWFLCGIRSWFITPCEMCRFWVNLRQNNILFQVYKLCHVCTLLKYSNFDLYKCTHCFKSLANSYTFAQHFGKFNLRDKLEKLYRAKICGSTKKCFKLNVDFIAFSNFLSVGTCIKTGPVSIIEEAGENISCIYV